MQFFETVSGALRAVSAIRRISRPIATTKSGGKTSSIFNVTMDDGEQCEVTEFEHERILHSPDKIWAAASGTYLLYTTEGVDPKVAWKTPVIAWKTTAQGFLYAVTYSEETVTDVSRNKPVLLPDGSVVVYDEEWETQKQWLDDLRRDREVNAKKMSGAATDGLDL